MFRFSLQAKSRFPFPSRSFFEVRDSYCLILAMKWESKCTRHFYNKALKTSTQFTTFLSPASVIVKACVEMRPPSLSLSFPHLVGQLPSWVIMHEVFLPTHIGNAEWVTNVCCVKSLKSWGSLLLNDSFADRESSMYHLDFIVTYSHKKKQNAF